MERGGGSRQQGQADRLKLLLNPCALGLIRRRTPREGAAVELGLMTASARQRANSGGEWCEIHREDGELAVDIRAVLELLFADAEVALGVGNDRHAEEHGADRGVTTTARRAGPRPRVPWPHRRSAGDGEGKQGVLVVVGASWRGRQKWPTGSPAL